MNIVRRLIAVIVAAAAAAACTETGGPGGTERFANVQVSFATQQAGGPLQAAFARAALAGDTVTSGADTLVIDTVKVVVREVELKRLEVAVCDSVGTDDDGCEEFSSGPVLVTLPLGAGAEQRFAVDIPAGTYTQIEFDVHKPDDEDPQDQAFIAANPLFADISIRVVGTFNDSAFVFTSDLNEKQEIALVPALEVIDSTSATNVTILVDVATWFRRTDGSLVDPLTANKGEPNEQLVTENIKRSIDAFEDEDGDGSEDDG